jgi:prepilin-type N-terminal cleavage/methylation domain-containing protein
MIPFKNKHNHGFTLIEAMIAIAIVGMTLTPMFILDTNVYNSVTTITQRFHRFLFAKNFIFEAEQKQPPQSVNYSTEKKEERPITMVRYTLKSIPEQSSLAKIKQLYRQEVVASGPDKDSPSASIVQFVYKPKEAA